VKPILVHGRNYLPLAVGEIMERGDWSVGPEWEGPCGDPGLAYTEAIKRSGWNVYRPVEEA
jgi:hypothetical protein